jgi:spermidine/putrescine transport system substrate-binding protein
MRDQMGVAHLHLGQDVNSTAPEQVKRAGELLAQAKRSPRCLGIGDAVENVKKVISGAADVAVVWNGDALRLITEEKAEDRVAYAAPATGAVAWVDVMVVPAKAPDAEAAYRFMDYLLEPKAGANLSNFNRFASPNLAAKPHIAPEDLANPAIYPPDAVRARLAFLAEVGQAAGLYDEVWTAVSAAQ